MMLHPFLEESDLEQCLTAPSEQDIDFASRLEGDVTILGAGGKLGPSLAVRMVDRKFGLKQDLPLTLATNSVGRSL